MQIQRLADNPIITPAMDASLGDNINGPSLIRVPQWIENPLGQYYLYFAHHDGRFIRLAYADSVEGPWTIHTPGVLPLNASGFAGHIASPDVHVDNNTRRIRMYFHGCELPTGQDSELQYTRVATSPDGLSFTAGKEDLGMSYFRVFEYDNYYYALQMPGLMLRSRDPLTGFEPGPTLFPETMRHSAVVRDGDRLCVLWTNVGDSPESILMSWIDLSRPWLKWKAGDAVRVLEPELDYEGANAPLEPSTRGLADGAVRQLRDPALFFENDTAWLVYAIAGESGLALARIESWR